MGSGFLEAVYQEALAVEFNKENIPFEREQEINISYKGINLSKKYISDFIFYGSILMEIKAVSKLTTEHESQVLNYLKETRFRLRLLVNFGSHSLEHKRLVL